jgi:hypothetical protein
MRDRFRGLATLLLVVSVGWTGWLLANPESAVDSAVGTTGTAMLPSLGPVVALAGEGRGEDAIMLLASLVRAAPGLADKGGALAAAPQLRDLVLVGWKGIVASSGERAAELTKEIRFLQRRLAGGCS